MSSFDGRSEFDSFRVAMGALSVDERTELLQYLCSRDRNDYARDQDLLAAKKLRDAARFFVPISKADETRIWETQRRRRATDVKFCLVPEDERVEDAALTDQDVQPGTRAKQQPKHTTHVHA